MNLENNINNSIIKINDSINCFNLLKEEKNIDNNNVNKMNNNIFNDEINKNEIIINNEYQEKEINLEKINNNKEYEKKINYEFVKDPKNLKYKSDLISSNSDSGYNDIFEIYISYKDNQEYIVSPNCKNFNLNIFNLRNNQKILSLQKHENSIRTIRYFINNKNKNEYLISADSNQKVIIWDITNNYNIKYIIDTKYASDIYSCLLVFPENMNDNFIVTSTYCMSKNNEEAATKVYSFKDGKFIF
jgi:WD40 repeat protein